MVGCNRPADQRQRQGITPDLQIARQRRQTKDQRQREHCDALIPAQMAGGLTQHLTDEQRAKRGGKGNGPSSVKCCKNAGIICPDES